MASRAGFPKGATRAPKRELDPGFPARLKRAMDYKPGGPIHNAALAREIGCTRAVISRYLNPKMPPKSIDPFLLFAIADALRIDARWLLFPEPEETRAKRRERV